MSKYGESKTTRIMMATVPHVTSGLELRKFQADGCLLTRVYNHPCLSAPLYDGIQRGQEISPTLCIFVLDVGKCLVSLYRHFKPGDWEIPVKLAYSRAAVCLRLIFLLCF